MNYLKLNQTLVMFTLTALGIAYQNFDLSTEFAIPMNTVDHSVRATHAKELLGRGYKGSIAQRAEKIHDLHVTIHEDVRKLLPRKYKGQSLALTETIIQEATKYDFDPVFVMAIIKTESSFNPKARGSAGEIGLMQLKPTTAKEIAEKNGIYWHGPSTLENPVENVRIGVAYFAQLREKFAGFANKYISSYNMGAAKVRKLYKNDIKPSEYSIRVIKNYKEIYKRMVASRVTAVVAEN